MAAGEARGRGDRGGDRVDELEGRGQLGAAAAADDLARDPVGEALLAVLAQHAREPAAVPGVDDLARRSAPASGPCACRAARRRRRRTRARACRPASRTCRGPCRPGRRATPSSTSVREAVGEVGADEARARTATSAASSANASSASGSRSIAISVPAGPSRSATRRAWPPRAERAVDGDLARAAGPAPRSAHRRGPGRACWGMSSRMAKRLGEVRRARREVGVVGLPGRAVPELEAVAGAGDHDLAVDARVLAGSRGVSITRPARIQLGRPARCRRAAAAARAPAARAGSALASACSASSSV